MFKKRNSTKVSKCGPEKIDDYLECEEKEFSKNKKPQKRQNKDISEFISQSQNSAKKRKSEVNIETSEEPRQKLIDAMSRQLEARKLCDDSIIQALTEIIAQLEEENNAMIKNKQTLEHLSGAIIKYMLQATTALQQKLKTLKGIHSSFKKRSEDADMDHRVKTKQFGEELEMLRKKLLSETKRNGWETLRRTIFDAIQNDFED